MSLIMTLAAIFVFIYLPNNKTVLSSEEPRSKIVLDTRLKYLISIGIIIFTAFALVQSITAFYIQDRFNYDLDSTAQTTAILLGTMAFMAMFLN